MDSRNETHATSADTHARRGTPLVSVVATATGGRDGQLSTADGKLSARLAFPPELGGDGNGLSPEHLFGAGHAACFGTSLRAVAQRHEVTVRDVTVTATVTLLKEPDGHFRIWSQLAVRAPELPAALAQQIIDETHDVCAYSRALRGHADVTAHFVG